MKRINPSILFALILFAVFSIPVLSADSPDEAKLENRDIIITDGVLDLRNLNQVGSELIYLDGPWEFYWKIFLYPSTDRLNLSKGTGYFDIPGSWNGYDTGDEIIGADGFASYKLTVLVDEEDRWYGLKLLDFGTAYQLWIDGELMAVNGRTSESIEGSRPEYRPQITVFKNTGSSIEIVLQISNFIHAKGGPWTRIQFGTRKQIMRARENKLAFDLLLFGAIFIMGLYHFAIYFLRRGDRTPLFFGIVCLIAAIRILFTGELYFASIFPGADWEYVVKGGYLSFYLIPPFFILYISSLYPEEFHPFIRYISLGIGALFTLIVLFSTVAFYSEINFIYQLFTLLMFLYMIFLLLKVIKARRENGWTILGGYLIILLALINDILFKNDMINSVYMAPFSLFIFFLSQSIVLSRRFSKSFSIAESLSRELEAHNETLEAKIAERTRELEIQAVTDSLTGLGNRLFLDEVLVREIQRSERYGSPFSLILLDIDHFKKVNDIYGHQAGDQTIKTIAEILRSNIRVTDSVGRWGGEEFLLLCSNTDSEGAYCLAENLRKKIEQHNFSIIGKKTSSFGVATFRKGDSGETMVERTDKALYRAKENGRNRVEILY